jgi:UDP-N-acetylmuramoylalanine--D-glutamate ligase
VPENYDTIAVIGYGLSGKAAEALAHSLGLKVKIFDDLDGVVQPDFSGCGLIVISPGVPPSSATYQAAVKSGIELVSELEFGSRHCPCRMLAITGTNGKTTTTELTVYLLKACGIDARPAGNIGLPLCEAVMDAAPDTVLVIEVSSFQLELCGSFAPEAAAILNIDVDHLDRYNGDITDYAKTKMKIFNRIECPENCIAGFSLMHDQRFAELLPAGTKNTIVLRDNALWCGDDKIIDLADTKLNMPHNVENLAAALELVRCVCGHEALFSAGLVDAVKAFTPGAHRMEIVLERDGVIYVNDSKATNPAAVVAAVNALRNGRNILLILGGLDKGMDFSGLRELAPAVKRAYITGSCRDKIASAVEGFIEFKVIEDFDEAVRQACREAVTGDVVLLSPACIISLIIRNAANASGK